MHAPRSFSDAFCTVIFIGFIYLLLYSFIYHFSMSITPEEIRKKKTTSNYAMAAYIAPYKMMRVGVCVDVFMCMWKRTTYIIVFFIYQPSHRVLWWKAMASTAQADGAVCWLLILAEEHIIIRVRNMVNTRATKFIFNQKKTLNHGWCMRNKIINWK